MYCLNHFFNFRSRIKHGFITLMLEHGQAELPFRLGESNMAAFRLSKITRLQTLLLWVVMVLGTFPQQKFLMLRR